MSMTVFELAAKISLDSAEYEKGLKGSAKTANDFAKKLDSGVNKMLKIGTAAAGAAAAGMVAFGKAAVENGMQFDTAMSQVAATMGKTTDEIQELRDFAQKMGAETAFSATQAAEALNYMALAGYDAETSMAMLPNVLNLAAAGAMDLGRASDMLTDSQSALGLTLEETNELVDKMAQTASKSNTSVEQLGDAILTVGGTAKNLTGGTTELATALGILADNGVKGAEGGTALRNIILSLSAPTDTAVKKLNALGVAVFDSDGAMRGLNEVFGDLSESMSKLTQEQRMEALATIFNNRDLKSAEALLANYSTRWDELSGYIDDAAGAAQKMADTQLDNLNGDITLMNSALEGVKIAFSDGITPALRDAVQTITKAVSRGTTRKALNDIGKLAGNVVTSLTKWTSNALPRLLSLFDDGAVKLKVFGGAFAAFVIAVKATVNPIGALVTALGLLAGGLTLSALGADDMRKKLTKLTDEQWSAIDAVKDTSDAYADMKRERDASLASIHEETGKVSALWSELKSLADESGRVKDEDRERAEFIIGELNAALGTEMSLNEDVISQYQQMQDEIDRLIEKKRAEAMISAGEDSYQQAKTNLGEIEQALLDQKQVAIDAWNEWQTYVDEHPIGMNGKKEAELRANRDEQAQIYSDMLAQEQQYYHDIQTQEEAYRLFAEGNFAAVEELYANDTYNKWQNLAESGKISEQMLAQLQRDADVAGAAYARYAKNLANGVEGYTAEGLAQMRKAADDLNALYADAVDQAGEKGKEQSDQYAEGLGDGDGEAEKSGNALVEGFMRGIVNGEIPLYATAARLGEGAAKAFRGSAGGGGALGPGVGQYASGLDYVPYDRFPAYLHEGEAVLTKQEANSWRNGNGGNGVTLNIYAQQLTQADMDYIVATVNRELAP